MTITAACVITLKKPPTYRLAQDGKLPVWSGYGISGKDALSITAFRGLAEELEALQLGEGDALSVIGDVSLNNWVGKDGAEYFGLKLIVSKAEAITAPVPKRRATSKRTPPKEAPAQDEPPFYDDPIPF